MKYLFVLAIAIATVGCSEIVYIEREKEVKEDCHPRHHYYYHRRPYYPQPQLHPQPPCGRGNRIEIDMDGCRRDRDIDIRIENNRR